MIHDTLCLLLVPCSTDDGQHCHLDGRLPWCNWCKAECNCDYIAEVRADERERAAQRVSACEPWSLRTISAEDAIEAARRSW